MASRIACSLCPALAIRIASSLVNEVVAAKLTSASRETHASRHLVGILSIVITPTLCNHPTPQRFENKFLAPDHVRMEMKVAGLGDQTIVSDGRMLWTITPQARVATKVDLVAVQKSWGRTLPNQAMAIRDVFEVIKPGTVQFMKEERVR